jgi:hypothetical protein
VVLEVMVVVQVVLLKMVVIIQSNQLYSSASALFLNGMISTKIRETIE